jgi:hypothetical protein
MNHPKIIAGRHGLPPTSNIPWSIAGELELRRQILFYFVSAWGFFLGTGALGLRHDWLAAVVCGVACGTAAFAVSDLRRMLYAMLLNKPRSTEGLTQWIEHARPDVPPPHVPAAVDHDAYLFLCRCGRLVDMALAPYFKDSGRFSVICECGIGHFMVSAKGPGLKLVKR